MEQVAVGSGVDSLSKVIKLHLPYLPLAPNPLNPVSVAAPGYQGNYLGYRAHLRDCQTRPARRPLCLHAQGTSLPYNDFNAIWVDL